MNHREQWRPLLDAEIKRWYAKSCAELVAELQDEQIYEVEFEGRNYQVEVRILENTDRHIHVAISVDDGTLPASLRPLSSSFIREK
jgi:hypothetical protein